MIHVDQHRTTDVIKNKTTQIKKKALLTLRKSQYCSISYKLLHLQNSFDQRRSYVPRRTSEILVEMIL